MRTDATDVDQYLDEVPAERRPVLESIRAACLEELTGFDEVMAYGMPTYRRDGTPEIAWKSQKQHLALYVMRSDVVEAHRDQLADVGKGCIRYRRPEQVDLDVVRSILRRTATTTGPVC